MMKIQLTIRQNEAFNTQQMSISFRFFSVTGEVHIAPDKDDS